MKQLFLVLLVLISIGAQAFEYRDMEFSIGGGMATIDDIADEVGAVGFFHMGGNFKIYKSANGSKLVLGGQTRFDGTTAKDAFDMSLTIGPVMPIVGEFSAGYALVNRDDAIVAIVGLLGYESQNNMEGFSIGSKMVVITPKTEIELAVRYITCNALNVTAELSRSLDIINSEVFFNASLTQDLYGVEYRVKVAMGLDFLFAKLDAGDSSLNFKIRLENGIMLTRRSAEATQSFDGYYVGLSFIINYRD